MPTETEPLATPEDAIRAPASGEAAAESQFALLRSRRFLPLFVTQFFGAFNDNLYKQALAVLFVFGALVADESIDLLVNAAAAIFIAPFFLFSAVAGNLADHRDKAWLMRRIKVAEIFVAASAGLALFSGSVTFMLIVLFLLGVQSTFFGPAKYAILPQHLSRTELTGGNALVQSGTFVAILLGTIAGGVIGASADVSIVLFVFVVLVSVLGYLASRAIPSAPPLEETVVKTRWLADTWALINIARERRAVFLSVLGISWFWLLGSVYLTQIPNLTRSHLFGNPSVVTTILTLFTVAIALGSLACERLSAKRVEIGLVPLGAMGVSIFGIDAYFAIEALDPAPLRNGWAFIAAEGATRVLVDLALIGIFAGLFVVPLQATIQVRTPEDRRARVIAANNVLNSLFMVAGAGIAMLALSVLELSIPSLFLILSAMNLAVAFFIFYEVPEFSMRFIIWLMSHSMYRVHHDGLERIPARGGAVIVANHVSYVDALLLAGAVSRPIRFVMYKPIYDIPVLNFVFRTGRAVPIAQRKEDPNALAHALDEIRSGLEAGDVFCIFPEGKLTTDGAIDVFRPGIERIVAATPVPVIPVALRGLWGSVFSRQGRGPFTDWPRKFFRRVDIVAGAAVEPRDVSTETLRAAVLDLRGAKA